MIADLNETFKHLLIERGELDPAQVVVTFQKPPAEPEKPQAETGVNFHLYDIRENLELRESQWDTEMEGSRRVRVTRRPLRMDLKYSITCWAKSAEAEHQLLWHVLETLFRNSPLPDELLQGGLRQLMHPVITRVAQPDGTAANPSDAGPSINLIATVDLDLNEFRSTPLVFARGLKLSPTLPEVEPQRNELQSEAAQFSWEAAPLRFGGLVHRPGGQPVEGASVRLIGTHADGSAMQFGPTVHTDDAGHYVFASVPPGQYTLVVELPGQPPQQRPLTIAMHERGEPLPALVNEVEVAMTKT
jgi:Pvc16 N-terminal domain/Carboxypeptidase regulatory-like domain